ncbi:retrovirus-related pol polyprotein from transposon TNT 1-94 [Tanacetum coccineum]
MKDGIFFNQSKYIKEMLKKFGLEDSKPTKTPMSTEIKLTKDDEADSVDSSKYRGMIGSLLYLTASRPDIMFSVCLCARFQENPKTTHLEAVKRIFRYIRGTSHLGLWYLKGTRIEIVVYADSDHAGDYVDRKSTSGVCTFMGCCLTSWFAKKQTALAISMTEAEYVSAGKACQQALWMKQALIDYGIRLDDVPIMCDNKGAIDLSKNPVQHSRTKHIEIRHHFLRDNVQKGNISIKKVASEDNIADIFTKPLKRERFGGNAATKKTQRNLLKQQYENFTAPSLEMLDQTFDRLLSQLELLDEKLSQEDKTSTSIALVSCDGLGGYDWSDQAEEGPNYALMAFLSSSPDSEVSNDSICSKSCLETVELLKSQNDQLLKDLKKSELMVLVVLVNTARQVKATHSKTTVNAARPMSHLSKIAYSTVKSPIHKNTAFKYNNINQRVNTVRDKNFNTARPKVVVNAVKRNNFNAVKASACWVWKLKHKVLDHGNPQMDLHDQGVIDSGCSRNMTGNMSYLTDNEKIDGGYVAFKGNPKGGKITGKCTIKIAPKGDLTCLFAKATSDESKLWHRRLGHLNFKTMNKLVKGNLVRGLPSKLFENDQTCVAYQKGKKHRASYYFGCPVTILNTIDHLGKFDGKADEGFFVGYSLNSKAFRVFNSRTRIVEENLHIRFNESTPNVVGSGPDWLFDIDALTRTMNYEPIIAGTQSNGFAGTKASDNAGQARKET